MDFRIASPSIMKTGALVGLLILLFGCTGDQTQQTVTDSNPTPITSTSLIVLGTIQDGGSPHPGCNKNCCKDLFDHPDPTRQVVSLGVIDPDNQQTWLFEATPDLATQMKMLKRRSGFQTRETPDGIFLTHAHIGHYTGLMYLGMEAMNSDHVPVYVMPWMQEFLQNNGPCSQLVDLGNIAIQPLENDQPVKLSNNVTVTPILVPHRDEYSETVGYHITGPNKTALFIPDIDKWQRWDRSIIEELRKVDYAFVDATFYDGEELNNRDMSEIPHPFIAESMALFDSLPAAEKNKVYFIHFNHTNPVIDPQSEQAKMVLNKGYHLAMFGQVIDL